MISKKHIQFVSRYIKNTNHDPCNVVLCHIPHKTVIAAWFGKQIPGSKVYFDLLTGVPEFLKEYHDPVFSMVIEQQCYNVPAHIVESLGVSKRHQLHHVSLLRKYMIGR